LAEHAPFSSVVAGEAHGGLTTDELPVGYLLTAEAPSPLVTTNSAGEVIGQLDPSVHHDVSMLIDAGFQMFGTAVDVNGARLLSLRLDVD
jgi:hypothetical protein